MVFDSLKNKVGGMFGSEEEEEEEKFLEGFEIKSASNDIIELPDVENIQDLDVTYPLIKPFANAHIFWDDEQEDVIYRIEEPELTEKEEEIFRRLKRAMEKKIDVSLKELNSTDKIVGYLGSRIKEISEELGMTIEKENMKKLMYFVYRNFAGLNELEPLMHDPYIEDIGCSGMEIPTYVVHSKFGSIKTNLIFKDKEKLKNLVVKLAERCGKYVSYADPLLDGSLPDGSRVNASLTQDVTTKGPTISIRKFQEVPYSAIDLIRFETVNKKIMAYFWMALQYQNSILISGGTATGKTTFLNSIVTFIPPEQKIVSIEDTRELQLPHENWIPSVARSSFGVKGGSGQDIDMYQLLRESFRQNPDYVVVGEVRGEEASVLFQGMSSGHPSMGTIHASSPNDVVKRLTTPPINLSPSLVETLDIVVIITRARQYGESARRVKGVYEIEAITPDGSPRTNQYISWTPIDDTFAFKNDSNILNNIRQQFGYSQDELEQEMQDRVDVLEWMDERDITSFSDVAKVVSEYYKDKDAVMDAVRNDRSLGDIGESKIPKDLAAAKKPKGIPKPDKKSEKSEQEEKAEKVEAEEPSETSEPEPEVVENPFAGVGEVTGNPFKDVEMVQGNPFEGAEKIEKNPFE